MIHYDIFPPKIVNEVKKSDASMACDVSPVAMFIVEDFPADSYCPAMSFVFVC